MTGQTLQMECRRIPLVKKTFTHNETKEKFLHSARPRIT